MLKSSTVHNGLYLVAGLAILAAAAYLRIQNSEARILHSDEAVQAYQLWELMETGNYEYDPVDKHGPTLYYASFLLNKVLGMDSGELSHTQLRLGPLLASLGLILFALVKGWRDGRPAALIATTLFAMSPLPVIYGAYFVQEALFALLGFVALYSFQKYWRSPSISNAALFGVWTAALFATKETAIIHLFATALAVWLAQESPLDKRAWIASARLGPVASALGAFALVWIFFFSSAFSDFSQLGDSLKAFVNYADRSQGQGHEKPMGYYLSLFWPHKTEGVSWNEALFLILAALGGVIALVRRSDEHNRGARLAALYGLICFVVYSLIPYKTPWLLLSSYLSFAYAVAIAFAKPLSKSSPMWARVAGALLLCVLFWQQYQTTKRANYYSADARNSYIYQHTSSQFAKLVQRIEDLEALDQESSLSIAVAGDDNAWPLPWYLRESETVGYWPDPSSAPALDLVIGPAGSLPQSLSETHIPEYHGLRQNVLLECWIRNEIWDAFMKSRE